MIIEKRICIFTTRRTNVGLLFSIKKEKLNSSVVDKLSDLRRIEKR